MTFSPHTRGCSSSERFARHTGQVFPAYAGMFRGASWAGSTAPCFPRIRGDVPYTPPQTPVNPKFSPHTRGCSYQNQAPATIEGVFPAYAGMFPPCAPRGLPPSGFPRIRGDVPVGSEIINSAFGFSPHTRGCSWWSGHIANDSEVFPAYAGMFPYHQNPPTGGPSFPRIRGDVPVSSVILSQLSTFSPHTRGCSRRHHHARHQQSVFPAYAGMFPERSPWLTIGDSFPRIRGDVPP